MFEYIIDFIAGRARSTDASYVILVKQDNRAKFEAQYRSFQSTEQYIQKVRFSYVLEVRETFTKCIFS